MVVLGHDALLRARLPSLGGKMSVVSVPVFFVAIWTLVIAQVSKIIRDTLVFFPIVLFVVFIFWIFLLVHFYS